MDSVLYASKISWLNLSLQKILTLTLLELEFELLGAEILSRVEGVTSVGRESHPKGASLATIEQAST